LRQVVHVVVVELNGIHRDWHRLRRGQQVQGLAIDYHRGDAVQANSRRGIHRLDLLGGSLGQRIVA
jgi:hypothetical protein